MTGIYKADWMQALERNKQYGLSVPAIYTAPQEKYFTASRLAELPRIIQPALAGLTMDDLVCQCLAIHFKLLPVLQNWLGCPVYFTLGWIDDGKNGIFKFGDTLIKSLLDGEPRSSVVNLHAWLTLPSMEIFDVTLSTTFAKLNNLPEGYGGVFSQHPDSLKGFAFKPMLLGEEFLIRSKLLRFE
ncbi:MULTISPECIES: hypothetical protein [Pseudomonas syringae group]|uniref:Uncharacterized protein n=1 Tax=Pseudomonas caricapapayae TaxID=46678 RepID=A0A3M6F2K9_9PSED|nr:MULTISPECIES: hypothetical protein [Pseudomonas syringae group]KPX31930.1 hypothetical protein ALO77_101248 [Pseudomonas coronafaciens pv. garcae]RMV74693.1 hypothetical protein ALP05_200044 [Pseudomonas caricapapayae]RMV81923.1 hypothetical protein ALP02_101423 [Pseudomonas coronafaciens pv. garcae]